MIEKIIELSIRNRFVVLILAAALTVAGDLCRAQYAGRCDSRFERKPGHCLYGLDGTQSAGNRGSGLLSPVAQAARSGRGASGPIVVASSTSR